MNMGQVFVRKGRQMRIEVFWLIQNRFSIHNFAATVTLKGGTHSVLPG
jgi:hypothetical protein